MINDYSFQLGNYQTGQIETIKDLSFKHSIDRACEAVRKGKCLRYCIGMRLSYTI